MIELECDNVVTHIFTSKELMVEISDLLSFEQPGAEHVMRRMPRWSVWDGKTRLLKHKGDTGYFPAGLTSKVIEFLDSKGLTYSLQDGRLAPPIGNRFEMLADIAPRPYQLEAVESTKTQSRGVIIIGTGGGKTFCSLLILLEKSVPTLFVTPDVGLKNQTLEVYRRFLGNLVSGDIDSLSPVVVSNIQAIAKKPASLFQRFKMLIVDEFHHSAAKSYLTINTALENAYWRYGLTGTNVRTDGRDMQMHGVLSSILYKKTTSDLIEDGWLVPAEITFFRKELTGFSRMNYREAYNEITAHVELNNFIADLAKQKSECENKQTLILVRRKEHGSIIQNLMFNGTVYLTGDDDFEYREEMKKKFLNREIKCLIATEIFGEGQDIPSIDCLINARFNQSEIQTKQGVGRALRLASGAANYEESVRLGKSKAEIYDFLPIGQKHLAGHAADRIKQYKSESKFKIKVERI